MAEEATELRQRLTAAIQEDGPRINGDDEPVVCTGWVLVAEWVDTQGVKWLSVNSGDAAGEPLTTWGKSGMLNEALNGDWPEFLLDEEDDDE